MSDILNPLGGRFVGPSGSVATTSVLGTVADPPRGLRQVDPGTIIKGVVLGRESDGLTAIATDKGTVRVAANVTLPAGAQVTLEVRPAGDRLQVLILSNDLLGRAAPPTTPQTSAANIPVAPTGSVPAGNAAGGLPAGSGEARPGSAAAASAPAVSPSRAEPSVEFVGSNMRAVVVRALVPAASSPLPVPGPVPSQVQAAPSSPAAAQPPQDQLPQSSLPPAQPAPPQPAPVQPPPAQPPAVQAPADQPPPQAPSPSPSPPPPPSPAATAPAGIPPTAPPQSGTGVGIATPPAVAPTTSLPAPPTGQSGQVPLPAGGGVALPSLPAPAAGGAPAPALPAIGPIVLESIPATTLTSAATVQAALLAAGAEKKDRANVTGAGSAPASASSAPASPIGGAAAASPPSDPDVAAAPTGGFPVESALTADAKQRILALFAAAGAMPDLSVDEIKPVGAQPTAPAQPLPLGAELKLRVLAVQMQAGQQVTIDPIALDPHDAQGQIIFGRVVSVTPAGHAVIHTPVGDIMLQHRSALVPGAQLALAIDTLESAAPPAMPTPVVQTPQQALLTLSQGWPTLADLVALLQGSSPEATRAAIDADTAHQALAMLPHAGIRLGAGLMNAMAALRSGDLAKLLGPLLASKGIGGDKDELVKRLKGEFAQLSALAQDRPEVDWRALFLPVIDDRGQVSQINLFYRRSKKGEAEIGERGSGTRFVVEADFSRLGPFQLDGLMRPQRFDLMVRSRQRLTERMRREIEAIYEETRGLTGFAGSIAFQTVNEFPVIPLDDLKKGQPTYTV